MVFIKFIKQWIKVLMMLKYTFFVNFKKLFSTILFQKNYNNSQAIAIIEAEMEATPERDEVVQFIKDSHRGIMKGYFKSN